MQKKKQESFDRDVYRQHTFGREISIQGISIHKKHLLSRILITVLLAAVLAGCGKNQEQEGQQEQGSVGYVSEGVLTFSQNSGIYEEEFTLKIESNVPGTIYYTTDGSDPTDSETRREYKGSIEITDRQGDANVVSAVSPALFDAAYAKLNADRTGYDTSVEVPATEDVDKCTVVKAVLLSADNTAYPVQNNTYFIGTTEEHIQGIRESCEAAGEDLAVISITMNFDDLFDPETGIYVRGKVFDESVAAYLEEGGVLGRDARIFDANYKQRGRAWEREAHIDFFEGNADGMMCVLQQDCGIRVQGNYSRSDLQKGFRLFARTEYGDNNFNYAVFGLDHTDDAGETLDQFKTLILRNGGNCAFTTKYSDTYWQKLLDDMDCDTQESRPCVVYLNGEYWGLYVLEEDYSQDYFADTHGVVKEDVVLYKGDAETYEIGYKLDLGDLPAGVEDVSYYYTELLDFFDTYENCESEEDYAAFCELVDPESVRDYFAVQIWINNKWDWPGKNWSMWRTLTKDASNEYADGRWRFCFYDMEFGGVSGESDAYTNTIAEDNYQPDGLLDRGTENPAVLSFVYLMSNEGFREDFNDKLLSLSRTCFERGAALEALDLINATYEPLYEQFFERYDNVGNVADSVNGGYASYKCIKEFLEERADHIEPMIQYVNNHYAE